MPEIDRDGVKIYYEVHGEGRPVLLSHGFTASSGMWKPQIGALVERGYRLIAWDQRGHGRSSYPDDPADYRQELAVGDMAAVLDAVGANRAVIGGLSLGGYLSLAFHLQYPQRTAALALFDTGPGFRNDDARPKWNALAERYAIDFTERGLDALPSRAEVEKRHRNADGLARAARGLLVQHDARALASLPDIRVPALVLVGEEDEGFLAASAYMGQKIPGAEYVV